MITLEDFRHDAAWNAENGALSPVAIENQIAGVTLHRLVCLEDNRGDLTVLMSDRNGADWRTPHVYLVTAAPGSIRAWVYHQRQSDRLAFTDGHFRVVLYDLRPESPTYGALNVMDLGSANRILLTIPPCVVHGVQNRSDLAARFVNMPTRAYDPAQPDKARLPYGHPGIPYDFG